jgi:signal transduction histidine kinase
MCAASSEIGARHVEDRVKRLSVPRVSRERSFNIGGCLCRSALLVGVLLVLGVGHLLGSEPAIDTKQVKRVVVLYSEPRDFPATEMTEKGIREVFYGNPTFSIRLFSEYLDLSRFRDVRQREALADLLRNRYGEGDIDLIVSVDVPAADFLLDKGEAIFPKVPIILCSIPEPLAERLNASPLRTRMTGVFEPMNAKDHVESALAFRPATKHAVLVSGAFENDRVRALGFRKAIEALGKRAQFIDLTGLSFGDLVEQVKKIPPDSVIFFSTLFVDGKGRSFIPREVLKFLSDISDSPIFGPYESYLGHGIVGGRLTSMMLQGKKAAQLGAMVLDGKSPNIIPFDDGRDTCISAYDWRQLRRWNISESELPMGSRVLYREVTLWDVYKSYIIGAISLIVIESMLIVALIVNLQKRKQAEVALSESRQDLRTLAGRLISSQEEELSRLSREFHDDIAQRLAAVAIESGTLELRSKHIEQATLAKITHIKEQLIGLSEDVSTISRQIHPSILKDLGLVRAINSQCVRFADRESIDVDFQSQDVPDAIPKDTALCIYRVIQEGLRNIAKHSQAKHVKISLVYRGNNILLSIRDDGIGFVPQDIRRTPGIGLASMRERVEYVNGQFGISSDRGTGTVIHVSVPTEKRDR